MQPAQPSPAQPSTEGFFRNGQIVYALIYRLDPDPGVYSQYLVVWLDRDGNALGPWTKPSEPGRRIVTTKPGDVLLHKGEPRKVIAVEVYRALAAS